MRKPSTQSVCMHPVKTYNVNNQTGIQTVGIHVPPENVWCGYLLYNMERRPRAMFGWNLQIRIVK